MFSTYYGIIGIAVIILGISYIIYDVVTNPLDNDTNIA